MHRQEALHNSCEVAGLLLAEVAGGISLRKAARKKPARKLLPRQQPMSMDCTAKDLHLSVLKKRILEHVYFFLLEGTARPSLADIWQIFRRRVAQD